MISIVQLKFKSSDENFYDQFILNKSSSVSDENNNDTK